MNIIRIRDKLKELRSWGAVTEQEMHRGLHAPVFVNTHGGEEPSDDEMQWIRENVVDGEIAKNLPFQEFVMFQSIARTTIYVFQHKTCLVAIYGFDDLWVRCVYEYGVNEIAMVGFGKGKKLTTPPPDGATEMANLPNGRICRLCLDIGTPSATVLKVEPPRKPGKPVHWVLARTHYLILTRKQAEACAVQKRAPTEQEVNRAAHWRRAHFRRLVAARYSQEKRAKLIPVRQAWVGPKEWTGLDGKIYKVVESFAA